MAIPSLLRTSTAWLPLISGAFAQSTTPSSNVTCPATIQQIANDSSSVPYNSTGSIEFQVPGLNAPWYLTLALTDSRGPNLRFGDWVTAQMLQSFISVPESMIFYKGNSTRLCVYAMNGLNETIEGDGSAASSCDSVLSEECRDAIRQTPLPEDDDCPSADVADVCGQGFTLQTTTPRNFSSPQCSVPDLPNVDLPPKYRSYGGFPGPAAPVFDNDRDSYEVYDLRVRQAVPMLVTVWAESLGFQHLLCVAPDELVDGSREPEGDFPSRATVVEIGWAAVLVTGMVVTRLLG